mmetsp:Transcript_33201/g.63980  ORF Transcript_33201/g.63980 Transcript_33201/m.63980 type:complete len:232 (-) Transcript_33201:2981-3676(-)
MRRLRAACRLCNLCLLLVAAVSGEDELDSRVSSWRNRAARCIERWRPARADGLAACLVDGAPRSEAAPIHRGFLLARLDDTPALEESAVPELPVDRRRAQHKSARLAALGRRRRRGLSSSVTASLEALLRLEIGMCKWTQLRVFWHEASPHVKPRSERLVLGGGVRVASERVLLALAIAFGSDDAPPARGGAHPQLLIHLMIKQLTSRPICMQRPWPGCSGLCRRRRAWKR